MSPPRTGSVEPFKRPSESSVQHEAERVARGLLAEELGAPLGPRKVQLDERCAVNLDAFSDGPPAILAELFAHQGPLKPGQTRKLMSDAFKLLAAGKVLGGPGARLILVLTDEEARRDLVSGWRGSALRGLGIEVLTVALPAELADRVRAAQVRQRMVNAPPTQESD
jgi:hypothetical protein